MMDIGEKLLENGWTLICVSINGEMCRITKDHEYIITSNKRWKIVRIAGKKVKDYDKHLDCFIDELKSYGYNIYQRTQGGYFVNNSTDLLNVHCCFIEET